MSEINKLMPFSAWVNFNDHIFNELDSRIRPLLEKHPYSLDREVQIRTLLYANFNNYLTLLLSEIDDNLVSNFITEFNQTPEDKHLDLVVSTINKPIEQIINNFTALFNHPIK